MRQLWLLDEQQTVCADLLTVYHTPEYSPGAHFGPALLPYHRELLKQCVRAVRTHVSHL